MPTLPTRASARVAPRADGHIGATGAHVAATTSGVRAVSAALGDFVRAGFRPRTPLQRGIAAALVIKLVVVIALRVFVFADETRVIPTDHTVARAMGVERR
ncbi:hypothetical protein [Bradyrhizobium sp. BR13661]|jgi:hypothetical protein|uniref:hypothetical protein n=1 Tax=Bradyrhizobium sp. BR13661 TaxID=2940622 RepID=UPI0024769D3A|nr:hypothetical protein [Bradyrhizobium sp. BR13661]MDH6260775.1 hypothetical protein [Bradyrhizobium sp. BR13661]